MTAVISRCPEELWNNTSYNNSYWRIVYHTLFYTALYLSESPEKFVAWQKHQATYNYLGNFTSEQKPIVINRIYSKEEMIDYAKEIFTGCEVMVIKNENKENGFEWLSMNRLELHLYNIRHLQHHIGQLIERLHQNNISGIEWVGMG